MVKTGVECEFFLVSPDGTALADERDTQEKPCYDQLVLMRRYELISEICDGMLSLGWKPYQNDHEDANGQYEMNWDYAEALVTADRHVFFKYMTKTLAEKHGLRATFMPKPFEHLTGNGLHCHVSLWNKKGRNLFHDKKGELGLSQTAYHFLGGLLKSARPLCAIFNPTVNSYKRINAPATASGATWAPNTVSYGGNNRTHMIRIPESDRFELRLADGSTNPYLMQAAMLAAGLDGISKRRNPGKRNEANMYTESHKFPKLERLPLYLIDALRLLDECKVLRDALGDETIDAFVKLKTSEWNDYCRYFSHWERDHTLDC